MIFRWMLVVVLAGCGILQAGDCSKVPRGPTGPAGANGTLFSNLLSVFTTTPQTLIATGQPVILNQLAIPVQGSAFSYNTGTGLVTFNQTGFYEVTVGVSISGASNDNAGFALQVNPGGIYSGGFVAGSGLVNGSEFVIPFFGGMAGPGLMTTVSVVVQITQAGQTFQLVSGQGMGDTIILGTGGVGTVAPAPVLAYMTINSL